MVDRQELETLAALPEQAVYVSVYLNIDPGTRRRPVPAAVFKRLVREELARLDKKDRRLLEPHIEQLTGYITFSRNRFRRGLVLFTCPTSDLWREYHLAVPLPNAVIFSRRPWIRPLAHLVDDYQPFVVALVDRRSARLFLVRLGEIDVYVEHEHPDMPGKHKKGGWFALSQSRYARNIEKQVSLHLEHVAGILDELFKGGYIGRVAVAGPPEAVGAFKEYLAPVVRSRITVFFREEVFAGWGEVLESVRELMENVEKEREDALVRELVERAYAGGRAVLGIDDVVTNLVKGNVVKLAIAADFRQTGFRCSACGGVQTHAFNGCPYCGQLLEEEPYLGDLTVQEAVRQGALVEVVRHSHLLLQEAGGIAALLRYA
ncbi:MAG: baeRF10 domain-containing protein [Desulfotomaculales bacterium]